MSAHRIIVLVPLGMAVLAATTLSRTTTQATAAELPRVTVQPSEAHFGTVEQNAIVEGSVLVMVPGDSVEGVAHEISPPAFVKVRDVKVDTQTYGTLGSRVRCHVKMSLDTSQARNLAGFLKVRLGDEHATIRMTVDVTLPRKGATRLLVVETPFHGTATKDWRIFDTWKKVVDDGHLSPNYLEVDGDKPVLRDMKLADFDVILIDGGALVWASEDDLKRLEEYVRQGGRLVVAASHFMRGSVDKANTLFVPFGFHMRDTDVRMEKNVVDFEKNDIGLDELTIEVKDLRIHRPTPMNILDRESARALVSSPFHDEAFVILASRGEGQLIGLGIPLWWKWVAGEGAGPDNAKLLQNLLTRPRR